MNAASHPLEARSDRGATPHPRIMVVEDEAIVAFDFQQRLERMGYPVTALALTAEEAVQKAGETNPELIFMDINLGPGSSGIDTAEIIRRRQDVPIIYVTANSEVETVRHAALSGPFGYILKPFEDRELEIAIHLGIVRHEMERRLKEDEHRFNTTLTSIADGVISTNATGRIIFFNPSAEKITGWRRESAVGRRLAEVFPLLNDGTHQADTDFFSAFLLPELLSGTSRTALLRCRNGARIPIEYRAAHMHDVQNRLRGAVISFSDISERKRAEAAVRSAQEEATRAHQRLQHRHEELQTFYHTVSHELKTPLTSCREFVSLVLEGLAGSVNETQREYLTYAQESCDQMAKCINDMLDVTRLQTGKMSVELKPASIAELTHRVVAMLKQEADQKGIHVQCDVVPDLPKVLLDETRIAQVLTNLLSNALKFTPAEGRVTVTASQPAEVANSVQIVVTDTGRGIAPEHLCRIFDRLYQVREDDATSCKGVGLGLHICRELVQLHGGKLEVESAEGSGSTFRVTLPVTPASVIAVTETSESNVEPMKL